MKHRKAYKKKWHDRRSRKLQEKMSKNKKVRKIRGGYEEKNFRYEDNLVDYFISKNFINKIKCGSKKSIDVPSDFTFFDQVDDTFKFLKTIVYMISKKSLKEIFINHCTIKEISLTASLILDLILMETKKYVEGTKNRRNLNICGEVKKNTDVGILIHANGVLPHLGFKVDKDPNVRTLELLYGDCINGNTTDPASDILKYFGDCLKMQGCTLTKPGRRAFGKFLGELLDNCRLHTGKNGKWYALGFYHNKENRGKCHIAILTIGDTIYESLSKKENVTKETHKALKNMTQKHKHSFGKKWDEEALWTWLSLQHGVSRLRDSKVDKNSTRGKGTVDIMEGFQSIGKSVEGSDSVFTIISGSTMIKFDFEKYPIEHVKINDEERRIIPFNEERSLEIRPDPNNVKKIDTFFPGTIYTMEFYIDPIYLETSDQIYVRRAINNE